MGQFVIMRRFRLVPATLTVAALLLVAKLFSVTAALVGLSASSLPIAEAQASSGSPEKPAAADNPAAKSAHEPAGGGGTSESAGRHSAESSVNGSGPGGDKPADTAGAPPAPTPSPQEMEILQQLAHRRDDLAARAAELDRRADLLNAAEARLDQKIKEMKDIEASLNQLLKKSDEQQEAQLRSLVKIYENMKPADAARILEQLDKDTLLPVVERMNERKLAPVMAQMNPMKAKAITEELAKLRQLVNGSRPPAAG